MLVLQPSQLQIAFDVGAVGVAIAQIPVVQHAIERDIEKVETWISFKARYSTLTSSFSEFYIFIRRYEILRKSYEVGAQF